MRARPIRFLETQFIFRIELDACANNVRAVIDRWITRLIGAVLMEQNDEWQTQNRSMQIEGMAEMNVPLLDGPPLQITPKAA